MVTGEHKAAQARATRARVQAQAQTQTQGQGAGAGDAGTPGAGSTQGFDLAAFCGGGFGVTSARHDERGANTP